MSPSKYDKLTKKFNDICADLNLDRNAADEAFKSYQRIQINYTLEGDKLHWLACALYVACQKGITPTVSGRGDYVQGNCVSLTRLLRSCKLSLVNFFNKMQKWSDMANLPQEMRNRIEKLERNFNVSTVIFKKYEPIFSSVFKSPTASPNKLPKNRKLSRRQLTPNDIFAFCWTLFVHVKSNFPAISDDLVNSYHLLLACIDFCYSNVLVTEGAQEILNPDFSELPLGFKNENFILPEPVPCIIQALCSRWQGLHVDAQGIKEHWWKPCIKRMVERKILRIARGSSLFLGFLDNSVYESNMKSISKEYDEFILNGDFDERIFLCNTADEELGTCLPRFDELSERVKQKLDETQSLFPPTPLSNRQYLANRENMGSMTPVTIATQTVSRLHSLLLDCKPEPSSTLIQMFEACGANNPAAKIDERIKELGECFLQAFTHANDDYEQESGDIANKRLKLATTLYYKCLEDIMAREEKKIKDSANNVDKATFLSSLFSHDLFHIALFSCSVEIVLFSYNSKRAFPWTIEVFQNYKNFGFQSFYFCRVIELIIREENGLSREVAKHLNSIEEQVLESMAWKSDSALWDAIQANGGVPSCNEVVLPALDQNLGSSPLPQKFQRDVSFQSPIGSPTSDRFLSPTNSSARRRLFDNTVTQIIYQIPFTPAINDFQCIQIVPQNSTGISAEATRSKQDTLRPRTGPLGLFFRKVYHLAWIRMRHLCDQLNLVDEDLRRKIWTCFETTLRNHTSLMRDRHLDQILMCSVYAIGKITKRSKSFQDIMKCYRLQPQARSHVYRSVLLTQTGRRNSASSDNSRHSGSNSPVREERDRIRSSSTLPVPHPNSQPPTPTRLAGTGSFDFDGARGDLIMFYNEIYIPELKQYIIRFGDEAVSPPLSPIPLIPANPLSPNRRISSKHSLYVSPLKTTNYPPSPNRHMSYQFQRSPAKDLVAINNMMRQNSNPSNKLISKRILQDEMVDGENENSPSKRRLLSLSSQNISSQPILQSKIQNIYDERQQIDDSNHHDHLDID